MSIAPAITLVIRLSPVSLCFEKMQGKPYVSCPPLKCDAFFIWLAPPLAYEIASGGASSKDKKRLYSVSGRIDATASGFTAVFARPRPEADFGLLIQHEF